MNSEKRINVYSTDGTLLTTFFIEPAEAERYMQEFRFEVANKTDDGEAINYTVKLPEPAVHV